MISLLFAQLNKISLIVIRAEHYTKFSLSRTSTNLPAFPVAVEVINDVDIDEASPSPAFQTSTSQI